jgi:hypothetical protein
LHNLVDCLVWGSCGVGELPFDTTSQSNSTKPCPTFLYIHYRGFSAGVVGELLHGQPLGAQLLAAAPQALAASLLLAAATAAPLLRGVEEGDEIFGPFVPASERLNGELGAGGGFMTCVGGVCW